MAKAHARAALAPTLPILLLSLILTGLALSGCGGKDPDAAVATFEGEPITLGYLEAKWAKLAANDKAFEPTPANIDSLRQAVLDIIIKKELIVEQARIQNYTEDESYKDAYEGQADYKLIELLKDKNITDKLPEFTEEDLKAHHKFMGLSVKARHIDLDTEEEAADVRRRIVGEELSFHDAVLQYSTNQDRFSGGELGVIAFGSNIKPVEDTLFSLEVGDVSQPVKTPYGWSLFTVDEIKEGEPEEYAAVRSSIERRLQMRAMRELGAAHAEQVLDKYGFEFNWDAAQVILGYLPDDPTPSQVQEARQRTEEKPILKFTDEELGMTLYELEGEKFTLQDFSDEYDRLHPMARPMKSSRLQGIYNWVHRDVVGKLMPKEAKAQQLDRDPDFILAMKEFEEKACIGAVQKIIVEQPIVVSDSMAREWYDDNELRYTLREQVKCVQIVSAEESVIRQAYKRLEDGEDFESVARDLSIAYNTQFETGFFTADSTMRPDNVAMKYVQRLEDIGDYTAPFEYTGYWGIMQLRERKPPLLKPFDEVIDQVRQDLKDHLSNARLDSLLEIWREDVDVEINERVLAKAEPGPPPNPNRALF